MRETRFVKQNEKKWESFEKMMKSQAQEAEEVSDLFVQITDDLSYARTYYPNRSVRVYLNGLAQQLFFRLRKFKKRQIGGFSRFWRNDLPCAMYDSRAQMRLSLLVFVGALLIGVLSTLMDKEFPRVIMGNDYMNMTLDNIRKGEPMGVYNSESPLVMTLYIIGNNMYVAYLTYLLGALFGLGTLVMMIRTGLMIGAFQTFFFHHHLFWQSFLAVWLHGTFEITSIILAGGAGLTMSTGLIFPGTYSRMQAFQLSARKGLLMMLGMTPFLFVAGLIEGNLTRHTEAPDWLRGFFIVLCLSFVIWYFVIYPIRKAKTGATSTIKFMLPPDDDYEFDGEKIKSPGEIFSESILIFRRIFPGILRLVLIITGVVLLFAYFLNKLNTGNDMINYYKTRLYLGDLNRLLKIDFIFWPVGIGFVFLVYFVWRNIFKFTHFEVEGQTIGNRIAGLIMVSLICVFILMQLGGNSGWYIYAWFLSPMFFVFIALYLIQPGQIGGNIVSGFQMIFSNLGNLLVLCVFYFLFSWLALAFANLVVGDALSEFISLHTDDKYGLSSSVYNWLNISLILVTFYFSWSILLIASWLFYLSTLEKSIAYSLREKIASMTIDKHIRGLRKER